jgi:hypothetical protein
MKISKIIKYLILMSLFIVSCNNVEPGGIQMIVLSSGSSLAEIKTFVHSQTGEILEASCYLVDLIDPETGDIIGTIQYCRIENITPPEGHNISRLITTININGIGSLVVESQELQTTQSPVKLFNSIVQASPVENNIIGATYEFKAYDRHCLYEK